jgi:hypothetical protein
MLHDLDVQSPQPRPTPPRPSSERISAVLLISSRPREETEGHTPFELLDIAFEFTLQTRYELFQVLVIVLK